MPKILVIDDEKSIRKSLREILEYENFKVDEAGDGAEGASMAEKENYDIILCDIKMPKIDGIEFLEKAKELNPDIPIIMISGHGTIEVAVGAIQHCMGQHGQLALSLQLNPQFLEAGEEGILPLGRGQVDQAGQLAVAAQHQ